jgi:hypothetical protein
MEFSLAREELLNILKNIREDHNFIICTFIKKSKMDIGIAEFIG